MALTYISNEKFLGTLHNYKLWKELNNSIKQDYSRGVNLHEAITEFICCYVNNFQSSLGKGSEDAIDPITQAKIQIKGTSNFNDDLTSFGPKSEFDLLHFARLDQEKDLLHLYDVPMNNLYNTIVNQGKNETFADQQRQGRRPRLSLIRTLIKPNNLQPYAIVNLNDGSIQKLN